MGYHELLEILEEQHQCELNNDVYWQFNSIIGHQGPPNKNDPNHKGCTYNVAVEWIDASVTHEPFNIFGCNAVPNTDRNMDSLMKSD